MSRSIVLFLGLFVLASSAYAKVPQLVSPEQRATRIYVSKSNQQLQIFRDDVLLKTYKVRFGKHPRGHKQAEGDERTPEGNYVIDYKNPNSKFHLSLHISYPNAEDRGRAKNAGLSPGGDIMVHGGNNIFRPFNWTDGCIAVTNKQIEEIWRLVEVGTPIEIVP